MGKVDWRGISMAIGQVNQLLEPSEAQKEEIQFEGTKEALAEAYKKITTASGNYSLALMEEYRQEQKLGLPVGLNFLQWYLQAVPIISASVEQQNDAELDLSKVATERAKKQLSDAKIFYQMLLLTKD